MKKVKSKKGKCIELDKSVKRIIRETIKKEMEKARSDLITSVKTELLMRKALEDQLKLFEEEKKEMTSKFVVFLNILIRATLVIAVIVGLVTLIAVSVWGVGNILSWW